MRLSSLLPLVLVACALWLASDTHTDARTAGAIVHAAPTPTQRTAGSYTRENRDLEEDDAEDDEEDMRDVRRAATAAQKRRAAAVADDDAESSGDQPMQLRLTLEQAYGSSPFVPRGDVLLNFNPSRGAKAITFSAQQSGSKKQLSSAVKQGANSLYRIRFKQEGQKDEDAIMAAVPACSLASSHYHENFIFNVDPYGTLLSVSYRTPVSECAAAEVQAALTGADSFTLIPKAKISFGKPGEKAKLHVRPGFDAASQAAHAGIGADPVPQAAAAPAPEKGPDGKPLPAEKGFWAKYWIYIVPLGIFMVMQAVVAPPEQGSQGGGGGGAARAQ